MVKIVMLGDSRVGKSSILKKFISNEFSHNYITTLGIDFLQKTIMVDGINIKVQVWDTAGQEKYRTMVQSYYKSAMGIILVYDISNEESFERVQDWMRQIKVHAEEDVKIVLCGNKADLQEEERQVEQDRGAQQAADFGLPFFETSAQSGQNIEEAFEECALKIVKEKLKPDEEKRKNGQHNPREGSFMVQGQVKNKLAEDAKQKKKGGCC